MIALKELSRFLLTLDGLLQLLLHLLHGVGVGGLGEDELPLHLVEVLLQEVTALAEGLADQGLAVQVQQVEREDGDLEID